MGKSRDRIMYAAFSLFEKRKFERVSVEDILKEADVSRGTFYKYFDSKYDLMYLYYGEFVNTYIKEKYTGDNWFELQTMCYQFGLNHKPFFRNVREAQGHDSFWGFMHQISFNIFRDIKCRNSGKAELSETETLTIKAFVEAAICVFKEAILGQSTLSAEELSEIVYSMIPEDYKSCKI